MLSQNKVSRISKFDRPKLDTPITVRVVFSKTGNLQYFSHLDLQRTWQRVLVRASIPMWYTQGFNPHSKIVFGVPLPVGSEGMEEMVDLRIDREITPAEIKAGGFDKYFVGHGDGIYPCSAAGVPFSAMAISSKGDSISDLQEDLAAEQKARVTYDNILRLSDDPDVNDAIKFLRQREIVHFQRFGEALRSLTE